MLQGLERPAGGAGESELCTERRGRVPAVNPPAFFFGFRVTRPVHASGPFVRKCRCEPETFFIERGGGEGGRDLSAVLNSVEGAVLGGACMRGETLDRGAGLYQSTQRPPVR